MWTALLDIADAVPQDWAVIGAQMVLLHALERGVQPLRFSADVDVLVNARVVSGRIAGFVQSIVQLGFELEGWSAEGVAHRYVRGAASIDVLAPEGLSSKSSLVTTPPGRTIQVPGETQALHAGQLTHRPRVVAHDGRGPIRELAPKLTPKDRQRLRRRRELLETTHDASRGIDRAADGVAALRVLSARDT